MNANHCTFFLWATQVGGDNRQYGAMIGHQWHLLAVQHIRRGFHLKFNKGEQSSVPPQMNSL